MPEAAEFLCSLRVEDSFSLKEKFLNAKGAKSAKKPRHTLGKTALAWLAGRPGRWGLALLQLLLLFYMSLSHVLRLLLMPLFHLLFLHFVGVLPCCLLVFLLLLLL